MPQRSPDFSAFMCLAVALVVPAAVMELYGTAEAQERQADPYRIEQQIQRMAGVQAIVPATARVGYVSDLPLNSNSGLAAFLSAEYALAPRLVIDVKDARPGDWVIGNFARPTDFASFGAKSGLVFQSDLGNGVVMYRKAAR